ncbi:aminoglycoside phosphotransferase [[Actinomadura] parvosata subsp. kistnae]|uniref:Aminoglycoside phosphotransferase n=1 Tax=[Actinomadura] parvosata subsp. kistnae TaxID=1909395 RepID=A0A1V0AF68_9ACTN|nr:phosphotransferase [Nonomuraea sp. ATCC 55076]AQZ68833.1 aminoglycoside phosphotransferase [Nonomuraea sp. ATCC 55076]
MKHGYTNSTFGDGALVVKCYEGPEAAFRLSTESRYLRRLRGRLPVPRVHQVTSTSLTTRFVDGSHGQDLLDEGRAVEVFTECGRMLARIHRLGIVHGDYGPQNMLFHPDTFETTAILDWEWAHPGRPVEDLAWVEWIVRSHHPEHVALLPHFFTAYGEAVPSWADRHAAMIERCQGLLDFATRWEPGGGGEKLWRERLDTTAAWTE